MDWTNEKADADAIDRATALEAKLKRGEPDGLVGPYGVTAGLLDFGTFGNGPKFAALRNALAPNKNPMPATEDEFARIRQNDPAGYYAGQAAGLGIGAMVPPIAALQTGAAIYNNPALQRTSRDFLPRWLSGIGGATGLMLAMPHWAVMHAARNSLAGEQPDQNESGR